LLKTGLSCNVEVYIVYLFICFLIYLFTYLLCGQCCDQ